MPDYAVPITVDQLNQIRALVPDTDAIYGDNADEYLFTDDQLGDLFAAGSNNVLKAAGLAMISVGNSEAMIGKVIKSQDLTTNASLLQTSWLLSGEALLKRADTELVNAANDSFIVVDYLPGIDWVEYGGIHRPIYSWDFFS